MKNIKSFVFVILTSLLIVLPLNSYATDCSGLLGNPNDENSVAWLIQTLLNYTRILGPLAVIILSSIDFANVIIRSDDDAMAKAKKKLIRRLIITALLFFIPTIANVLLNIFGITGNPTCGIN